MSQKFNVAGFLSGPKQSAKGKKYTGRFVCPDVQWVGSGRDLLATFTITAEQIADAAASNILWTDQDVQRGIQPAAYPVPARELSLAEGYPDPKKYIFDSDNADDIVDKLLNGDKLFLSPLVWNLRPDHFEAFYDQTEDDLYIYSGKVFLPDSHHRQQAIIKAVNIWQGAKNDYPEFTGEKEFKVELYFLTRESEGDYFFDKNQRPKPTAKSKAYDLTTQDALSLLAKKVIDLSPSLRGNVNRVTDRLVQRNPQVVTLSTVREMMSTFSGGGEVDPSELEGLAKIAAQFYDMLSGVRPELGHLDASERRHVREASLVDSAVLMHGYAALMRDYHSDLIKLGTSRSAVKWREKLTFLGHNSVFTFGKWRGDLFSRANPLWRRIGILKVGQKSGKLTIINTGASRIAAGRALRQIVALEKRPTSLEFLARN